MRCRPPFAQGLLGLLLLTALGACSAEPEAPGPDPRTAIVEPDYSDYPRATLAIGSQRLEVEVADTPGRQTQGLSGRKKLPKDLGLLFPYAVPARHGFWMKNMLFDIDIVWIRGDRVVDITPNLTREIGSEVLPIIRPREPADLVLEVNAGTAARRGWQIGDLVALDPELRPRRGAP